MSSILLDLKNKHKLKSFNDYITAHPKQAFKILDTTLIADIYKNELNNHFIIKMKKKDLQILKLKKSNELLKNDLQELKLIIKKYKKQVVQLNNILKGI